MQLLLRILGAIVFGLAGWRLGPAVLKAAGLDQGSQVLLAIPAAVGFLFGLLVIPPLLLGGFRWFLQQAKKIPAQDLLAGLLGLLLGLIVSALLAMPLSLLPGPVGTLAPFVISVIFGVLGMAVMVMRQGEIFDALGGLIHVPSVKGSRSHGNSRIVVDTSAIIDGRIADIGHTGFLQGTLVVPRFVLNELQKVADSTDTLRRNRGRRGLEILNRLQKDSVIPIEIVEGEADERGEVDGRLVKLAKKMRAAIITSDYNLNRVAEIQGVKVLNINELANALRSVVLPGEEMSIRIIQEGKEQGQGVGYLDDGTMVVVEGGKRFLNSQLEVVVTRVLQTAAGRLVFSQPKGNHSS
jgi:uncharacterized protein YacL